MLAKGSPVQVLTLTPRSSHALPPPAPHLPFLRSYPCIKDPPPFPAITFSSSITLFLYLFSYVFQFLFHISIHIYYDDRLLLHSPYTSHHQLFLFFPSPSLSTTMLCLTPSIISFIAFLSLISLPNFVQKSFLITREPLRRGMQSANKPC